MRTAGHSLARGGNTAAQRLFVCVRRRGAARQVQATPEYDTRTRLAAAGVDCKTWEIVDQGQCGACYAFAANRVCV